MARRWVGWLVIVAAAATGLGVYMFADELRLRGSALMSSLIIAPSLRAAALATERGDGAAASAHMQTARYRIDLLRRTTAPFSRVIQFIKHLGNPPFQCSISPVRVTLGAGPGVPGIAWVPAGVTNAAPAPALVYLHGGGWTIGNASDPGVQRFCCALAELASVIVVSVDYRLAPEALFPSAFDDALAAVRAAAMGNIHPALPIDRSRIVVGGDSAGGQLSASVALATASEPPGISGWGASLRGQLLVYPLLLPPNETAPSFVAYGSGHLLTTQKTHDFKTVYFGQVPTQHQLADWRAFPGTVSAAALSRTAPAFVAIAEFDVLRTEDELYREGDPRVTRVFYPRTTHGFQMIPELFPAACNALYRDAAAWLRTVVGTAAPLPPTTAREEL